MSVRTADLDRRLSIVEDKLSYLDQHGTRGVGLAQVQIADVKADVAKLEASLDLFKTQTQNSFTTLNKSMDERNRNSWKVLGGYVVALVPVYILLFSTLAHG